MDLFNEFFKWIDNHDGFVIAMLTLGMFSLNCILLFENRKLRKMGIMPNVIIYIRSDKRIPFFNLYISNIGLGPAFNVTFNINKADEIIKKYQVKLPGYNSIQRIETLPQGDNIMTYFGSALDLLKDTKLPEIEINIQYRNIFGIIKKNKSIIDVSSFEGMGRIGTPYEQEISKDLKEISRTLKNFKIKNDILLIEQSSRKKLEKEYNEQNKKLRELLDKNK